MTLLICWKGVFFNNPSGEPKNMSALLCSLSAWQRKHLSRAQSASPWRRPNSLVEPPKRHLCWPTWRRWRTTSRRPSASPTSHAAPLWTWSSTSSPTPSERVPGGGGEVLHAHSAQSWWMSERAPPIGISGIRADVYGVNYFAAF